MNTENVIWENMKLRQEVIQLKEELQRYKESLGSCIKMMEPNHQKTDN
jgi:hypothetical protein